MATDTDVPPKPAFGHPEHPALTAPPFFVVGCARSGTTLLRLMLDSHPSLAVPLESHFITELHFPGAWVAERRPAPLTLERILSHQRFQRWGLDEDRVRSLADVARPGSYAEVIRTVFAAFAESRGKPRWGDKTPRYAEHIPLLADLFPDARFIHLIRDGREAATSMAEQVWWPTSAIGAAARWRHVVGSGRRSGALQGARRYREVRLEHLIADPEVVLRELCDFLGETFSPTMLEYHRTARHRIWGSEDLKPHRRHLVDRPTKNLRDWRQHLTPAQQYQVAAAAQPLLGELGYTGRASPRERTIGSLRGELHLLPHRFWRTYDRVTGLAEEVASQLRYRQCVARGESALG